MLKHVAGILLLLWLPLAVLAWDGGATFAGAETAKTADTLEEEQEPWVERDHLLPGWRLKVVQLEPELFRLELRMRPIHSSGDGEARQVFLRGARDLVASGGFAGYQILRYEEGLDSGLFFGRRNASGLIRMTRSHTWGQ